ncbi:copper amine oxidase N-terminal domain protein [Veillonella sp. AS16]|nr:copper amine oxidase N-terminal domain protein [Veillonella sp. AS16]
MKLKQLILSSIALGTLAFTSGIIQPAQAAVGAEKSATTQNIESSATAQTATPATKQNVGTSVAAQAPASATRQNVRTSASAAAATQTPTPATKQNVGTSAAAQTPASATRQNTGMPAATPASTPTSMQNTEKSAAVTTQHRINVDDKVLEPTANKANVIYVEGQPLVALRQVSEALGYKVSWDAPTKTALIDTTVATLAVQPDSKQILRKGKLQNINLDTSESLLPAARIVDGTLYVSPQAFKLLLNDVSITKDEIYIAPQRSQSIDNPAQNGQQNGVDTFLPPEEDKVIPYEEDTSATKEKKPLVTVKRTDTKTDTSKTDTDDTKNTVNTKNTTSTKTSGDQRSNGLSR